MAGGGGGIGNKAQLRPAKAGAGAWPELGKIMTFIGATTSLLVDRPNADRLERRTLVPIT